VLAFGMAWEQQTRVFRRLSGAPLVLPWWVLAAFPGAGQAAETAAVQDVGNSWATLAIGMAFGITLTLIILSLRRIRNHGRALRGGEDFRDIADFAGDWVWEMDSDFRFTYLSARFFELFPMAPEAILGKTRREYIGPPVMIRFGGAIFVISTPTSRSEISNTCSKMTKAAPGTSVSAADRCLTTIRLSPDIREPAPI